MAIDASSSANVSQLRIALDHPSSSRAISESTPPVSPLMGAVSHAARPLTNRYVTEIPLYIRAILDCLPIENLEYDSLRTVEGLIDGLREETTVKKLIKLAGDTSSFRLLTSLYQAAPEIVIKELEEQKRVLYKAFVTDPEGMQALVWLNQHCPSPLGFWAGEIFQEIVKLGNEGLPMLEWLCSVESIDEYYLRQAFIESFNKENGFAVAKWIATIGNESISDSHFLELCLRDAQEVMRVEWIYSQFSDRIPKLQVFSKRSSTVTEWLLMHDKVSERSIQLEFRNSCKDSTEVRIQKRTFLWTYARSYLSEQSVVKALENIGPVGLEVLEWAYNTIPEVFTPYLLNWALLKAAVSGEAGKPLVEKISANACAKLSWWSFWIGAHILEKRGQIDHAGWIIEIQRRAVGSIAPPLGPDEIKLLLKSSHTPSGYKPLGNIPIQHLWRPLSTEELDLITLGIPWLDDGDDPFKDSDVEVVSDEIEVISPFQIRSSEAHLFKRLYQSIKQGKMPLSIIGDPSFQEKILKTLRLILSRPTGRWVILHVCRLPYPLSIVYDAFGDHYDPEKRSVGINTKATQHYSKTADGTKYVYLAEKDSLLVHELIHAIHFNQYGNTFFDDLHTSPASDSSYENLEEQFTIAGIDPDIRECLEELRHATLFALSENSYNCERGYPERYGHQGLEEGREYRKEKDRHLAPSLSAL
ncbi:MAG: hypothetical protein FJZ59_02005 [Chlamydiae bacterium]|nr:hypothetical protein [Chlamydiota bacterium]